MDEQGKWGKKTRTDRLLFIYVLLYRHRTLKDILYNVDGLKRHAYVMVKT